MRTAARLEDSYLVEVHVVDAAGQPLAVSPALLYPRAGHDPFQQPAEALSRPADGVAVFEVEAEQEAWVRAHSSEHGYAEARVVRSRVSRTALLTLTLPGADSSVDVVVRPVDDRGAPVRPSEHFGLLAELYSPRSGLALRGPEWSPRSHGRPLELRVPRGTWLVAVRETLTRTSFCMPALPEEGHPPLAWTTVHVPPEAPESQELLVHIQAGGWATFELHDPRAPERTTFEPVVFERSAPLWPHRLATWNSAWRPRRGAPFRLARRLPAGSSELLVEVPGFAPVTRRVHVRAGETTHVSIRLAPGAD